MMMYKLSNRIIIKRSNSPEKSIRIIILTLQISFFNFSGNAQQKTIATIQRDVANSYPMLRLVQGDVGGGKTLVAVMAALAAIESGYQVAFMAPTEILAEQHFQNIKYYSAPKTKTDKPNSMDDLDPELIKTFERLGIPLLEQKRISGIAVDVVFDSVSIGQTHTEALEKAGVVFCMASSTDVNPSITFNKPSVVLTKKAFTNPPKA